MPRNLPTEDCPNKCKDPNCHAKPWSIDTTKSPIIWVLGGPGSGKTTMCTKLAEKYHMVHLSTGHLLRVEIRQKTKRSKRLIALISKGALVPNHIVLELLYEGMLASYQNAKGFLIDDYPKEEHQGKAFEDIFAPCNMVLYLEAPDSVLKERLLSRIEDGSDRPDDTEEAILAQLKTFHDHNDRVIEQYEHKLKTVNASLPFEQVYEQVSAIIDPLIIPDPDEEVQKPSAEEGNAVSGTSKSPSEGSTVADWKST